MNEPQHLYWDSTCFICFLNEKETVRREICQDVLRHAKLGELRIWTSTLTIVEVVRPRSKKPPIPKLPKWAVEAIKADASCKGHIEHIWEYYHSHTVPCDKLNAEEIGKIEAMFHWPYIGNIVMDERIARKAVEFSRDFGLKTCDSIHAASAVLKKEISVLQRWDRDFDKIKDLIKVEEPIMISLQGTLPLQQIGPTPDDFKALPAGEPIAASRATEAPIPIDTKKKLE